MINNVLPARISSARRDRERHQEGTACGYRDVWMCVAFVQGLHGPLSSEAAAVCRASVPVEEGEAAAAPGLHRLHSANHNQETLHDHSGTA